MTEVTLKLSDALVNQLQDEARRRDVTLESLVGAVLEDFVSDDEMTKAEILESLRISMEQALTGDTRPARDVLDEIEAELRADADRS